MIFCLCGVFRPPMSGCVPGGRGGCGAPRLDRHPADSRVGRHAGHLAGADGRFQEVHIARQCNGQSLPLASCILPHCWRSDKRRVSAGYPDPAVISDARDVESPCVCRRQAAVGRAAVDSRHPAGRVCRVGVAWVQCPESEVRMVSAGFRNVSGEGMRLQDWPSPMRTTATPVQGRF